MKKLLFPLLLCPLFSTAQNVSPRFEKDTLYTSGGYKIYKGQILHLATGSSEAGYFRFIKFHSSMIRTDSYSLQNSTILVNNLKGYKYSGPDNNSIRIQGILTNKTGKKEETDLIMNFERATEDIDGLPAELTVPGEFKIKRTGTVKEEIKKQPVADVINKQTVPDEMKKLLVADEIKKLFDLYKAGALTKEEYEAQKKKLLDRQ